MYFTKPDRSLDEVLATGNIDQKRIAIQNEINRLTAAEAELREKFRSSQRSFWDSSLHGHRRPAFERIGTIVEQREALQTQLDGL